MSTPPLEEEEQEIEIRRNKRAAEKDLDEDDYDLLEEQGVKVNRSQKLKRLGRLRDNDTIDDVPAPTNAEELEKQLFDDDDTQDPSATRTVPTLKMDDLSASDDDLGDFVVDEEDRPIREPLQDDDPDRTEALQDLREIFDLGSDEELGKDDDDAAEYDDGDDDHDQPRAQKRSSGTHQLSLTAAQIYEPSVVAEAFLSTEDMKIRKEDRPERLQLRGVELRPDDDFGDEAVFIFINAFARSLSSFSDDASQATTKAIATVLHILHTQDVEVPFIAMYRREFFEPHLQEHDLWTIYDWDEKYALLQKEKVNLKTVLRRIQADNIDMCEKLVDEAENSEQVDDCAQYFQQLFGTAFDKDSEIKRPAHKDLYAHYKQLSGIEGVLAAFKMSVDAVASNVAAGYLQNDIPDAQLTPDEAAELVNHHFDGNTEAVLKAARFVLARDIVAHPYVRKFVREYFYEHAELNTLPTEKGSREIDVFHMYREVKQLADKPVRLYTSNDDQFVSVDNAQKEGYITVRVSLNKEQLNDLYEELHKLVKSQQTTDIAQAWNQERKLVCYEAVNLLLSSFERALYQKLLRDAQLAVTRGYADNLRALVGCGGWRPQDSYGFTESDEDRPRVRVMGCVWGEPVMCVVVDGNGEMIDHLQLNRMKSNIKSDNVREQELKKSDLDALKQFIETNRPNVIAIGASSLDARRLYGDLTNGDWHRSVLDDRQVAVEYADDRISIAVAHSARSAREMPEHLPVVRQALSLARYVQDPIVEAAYLFDVDDSILAVRLHHMQDAIDRATLLRSASRVFLDTTSKVGLEVNRMLQTGFGSNLLQFIPGFGPRKAAAFVTGLKKRLNGILSNRRQLIQQKLTGKTTFVNCAAFIRISSDFVETDVDGDNLDETRIHPESASLAVKLACEALGVAEHQEMQRAVSKVMKQPNVLDSIPLEEFAQGLQEAGLHAGRQTLNFIISEFRSPFSELRPSWQSLKPKQLFELMTNENDFTLQQGQLVNARVIRYATSGGAQSAIGATCRLDNGLNAFLHRNDISDKRDATVEDLVQPGDIIHARIKEIRNDTIERFGVTITCKTSDLQDDEHNTESKLLETADRYLVQDSFMKMRPSVDAPKPRKVYFNRIIDHPQFRNVTLNVALQQLHSQAVGDLLIRPSSKGTDHVTITWKLGHELFVHVDVLEKDKVNEVGIGNKLMVGDRKFDALDEILATYLEPIIQHSKEMLAFRAFRALSDNDIQELLEVDKQKTPTRIPYYFGLDRSHPGYFILWYLPHRTPKKEYISVVPEGFKFRRVVHSSLEKLLKWFKLNWSQVAAKQSEQPGRVVPQTHALTGAAWQAAYQNPVQPAFNPQTAWAAPAAPAVPAVPAASSQPMWGAGGWGAAPPVAGAWNSATWDPQQMISSGDQRQVSERERDIAARQSGQEWQQPQTLQQPPRLRATGANVAPLDGLRAWGTGDDAMDADQPVQQPQQQPHTMWGGGGWSR
eukprot:TRINITY_DN1197_c0_g1_i1.p1 TRINITY_DN1197_c0_g1~~TRINITY_DN1197_c0_g1_i1.p1  ORF type:complete len:1477 (+),score=316.59 TRINITY_DN1197_c0_g1_i1:41-4471(+)